MSEGTSMRPLWSGTISFVLINIPVRLYTATQEKSLDFNFLHKNDNSRIRYAKICEIEEKEVPYEELVKGYEYEKGKYVLIEPDDFAKADPKRSRSIEIIDFVNENDIDTIYYTHPYYLEPNEGADRSFVLLRECLLKTKKVAIAKFVLKEKEHLAVIKPYVEGLVLQQLKFAHEIRSTLGLKLPKEKPEKKELELALSLIEKLSGKFEIEKFKDDYYETMLKIIENKARGKTISPLSAEPEATEFADLMAKLKESLEKTPTKK